MLITFLILLILAYLLVGLGVILQADMHSRMPIPGRILLLLLWGANKPCFPRWTLW